MTLDPTIQNAINTWAVPFDIGAVSITDFNHNCHGNLKHTASVNVTRDARLTFSIHDRGAWNTPGNNVYALVMDNKIIKLGGTCTSIQSRMTSIRAGRSTQQIKNPRGGYHKGKGSVTNKRTHYTIVNEVICHGRTCHVYAWKVPDHEVHLEVLGRHVTQPVQTYLAYESAIFSIYEDMAGKMPILCSNVPR